LLIFALPVTAIIAAVAVAALTLTGGGGDEPETPSSTGPTVEALELNVREGWDALIAGDYPKLYDMLPDSVRRDCSYNQYLSQIMLAQAFLGEGFNNAEPIVEDVRIEGTTATYTTRIVLGGVTLSQVESAALWQNERWEQIPDPSPDSPCG
jgi:hypothetical protein